MRQPSRSLADGPLFVQSVLGLLGGIGAGRHQLPLATIGAAQGSHVRVGLEDSLWIGPGELARTNAEQVSRIRTVLEALNLEVATPDEAREILNLKGRDKVGF
ncbi:3-keto-5-aminohexanoate cleavage protein [Streptomyces endophyticus]|uniref:3-keto-5-aminohexanoate cleavage protein n=1 Tax=Streptomyces endophyticus TaxID=714166 RepID=A0ABU6F497_9ACTN|nr:3-keto-5-aminohexanoate cleavage protein [Streptomyces endophyticus]MEB8338813.1 3-keto-5-aminohexanoate cleavage protein [Streptomyces endophyticus]